MAKKLGKAKKLGAVKLKPKKGVKYFVRDANDCNFRVNDIDLVLVANEKKEVDFGVYVELKEKFPYLEFIEE